MGVPRALGYAASVSALLLIGCQEQTNTPTQVDYSQNARITQSELRLDGLEKFKQELSLRNPSSLWLVAGEPGYAELKTNIGSLTIEIESIKQQGSGSRVVFKVGNTTSATIDKIEIAGHWYAADKDGMPTGDGHEYAATLSGPMRGGSWAYVSLVLIGGKPTDIGIIMIDKAKVGQIALDRP